MTGGIALVIGIITLVWMPDSPLHASFLTERERITVLERIRDDQGGTENKVIKRDQIVEALTDVRSWLIVLLTIISMPYKTPRSYVPLTIYSFSSLHTVRWSEQLCVFMLIFNGNILMNILAVGSIIIKVRYRYGLLSLSYNAD